MLQITGEPVWSCEQVDKPLGIGYDDVRNLIYVASKNGCIYELSEDEGICSTSLNYYTSLANKFL